MLKKISFVFVGLFILLSWESKSQNCWEYEETDPLTRIGGSIVISEIYFDTHYSERIEEKYHHRGEYVELFNSSNQAIDISQWRIKDHQTEFLLPGNTIIQPGSILIIAYASRQIPSDPQSGFWYGKEKFVELFPEAVGYEDKIILQSHFVLNNPRATVQLYNFNNVLIDQVSYVTFGQCIGDPQCESENNYVGDLNNGDGGAFDGPIYTNLQAQLEAQGWGPNATQTVYNFKRAIYIENPVDYYDHEDLFENYAVADATPFSIPFNIELQEPSEIIDSYPFEPNVINNFSTTQNYIYAESFDVHGNMVAKSGGYFDGLGRSTVSYSWDKETDKVWGSEIRYDQQGRPALQTLPAPSCYGFVVSPNFLNGNYTTYVPNSNDYNSLNTIGVTNTDYSSLVRYYSDDNSNEPYQATTKWPYSRTVYDRLNPGNVVKSIGGTQIDDEWKTGYSFTVPAAQEMYYVYGSDYFDGPITADGKEVITKFFKTVVMDTHGEENVVFTDSEGKTLASARSGGSTSYPAFSLIGEQGFIDIHLPKNINSYSFFTNPSDYTVYDLKTGQQINSSSMTGGNVYRIESTPGLGENKVYIDGEDVIVSPGAKGISYNVNYYDFAVNYYDNIGRLVQSSQPLGFNANALSGVASTVEHTMLSNYFYNALGQLVKTSSPDEGVARFKYRKDGQIRFSQNSKQEAVNEVSFTNYDHLGRPTRSGVGTATFSSLDPDTSFINSGLKDVYDVFYDTPLSNFDTWLTDNGLNPINYRQTFLSGNVAMTKTEVPTTSITWYSYDAYGRVKWLVQNIYGLGLKTIHYEYDEKGNARKVIYQKDKANEYFAHQYTYNANNALVKVETSTSASGTFKEQAAYSYYKSGELKRVEIADGLQGTDYVYTLEGMLKSINNPNLNSDIGNDFNDVFGLTLDYYSGDYARSGTPITTSPQGSNRFDGNIKMTRWATKGLTPQGAQDAYSYEYNRDKWLEGARFGSANSNGAYTPVADYRVSDITYDANGNIQTLQRKKNTALNSSNAMDNLIYSYEETNGNRLNHITDTAVISSIGSGDIGSQSPNNYSYNSIGQLEIDVKERVVYKYNSTGLVSEVLRYPSNQPIVKFNYDDKGQRVSKESYVSGGLSFSTTYYVRDVSGNSLAVYQKANAGSSSVLVEQPIYGASRIGVHYRADGTDTYQLTDHLGNVRALVQQDANDSPMVYEEDFNTATTAAPWYGASGEVLEIGDQRLKCTFDQRYRGARLNVNLEANKTYQISYKVDKHLMQGYFQTLVYKFPAVVGPIYDSGPINSNGSYTFTITPTVSGTHLLYFRGVDPNEAGLYAQPNIFYIDDVEIKDTSVEVLAHTDYYPFGMTMPGRNNIVGDYRYAFQGQEKDIETGKEAFQLRLWDGRIGRWLTTDPYRQFFSPYVGMGNNPMNGIDPDGGCWEEDGTPCADGNIGDVKYGFRYEEDGWQLIDQSNLVDLGTVYSNPFHIGNGIDSHISYNSQGQYQIALPTDFGSWDGLGSDGRQWIGCMSCHGDRGAYRTVAYNSKERSFGIIIAAIGELGYTAFPRNISSAVSLLDDGVYSGLYNARTGRVHLAPSWEGPLSQMPVGAVPRRAGHGILRNRLGLGDETDLYGFTIKVDGIDVSIISTNSRSVNLRLHGDAYAADKVMDQINQYINSLK